MSTKLIGSGTFVGTAGTANIDIRPYRATRFGLLLRNDIGGGKFNVNAGPADLSGFAIVGILRVFNGQLMPLQVDDTESPGAYVYHIIADIIQVELLDATDADLDWWLFADFEN